ncbi:MAG: hypothetical protein HY332_16445 [Chloroflexi bacterium]|nr:hypothetical protein [Chloroflexota bacterium]
MELKVLRRTMLQQTAATGGLGVLAAACGPLQQVEAPDRSRRATGPAAVTYLNFFTPGDPQTIVFPRAQETFQQKFPQVTVESVFVPNAELAQRIATLEAKVVSARRSATETYVQQPSPYNRRPLVDSANFALNQPFVAQYDEMMKVINAALAAIDKGEKSPKQAMLEAKPQVGAILAQGS